MLTIRQNVLETIKGGHPDRFVKQYEFLEFIMESPLPPLPFKLAQGEISVHFLGSMRLCLERSPG
jgi:hypothetical protein